MDQQTQALDRNLAPTATVILPAFNEAAALPVVLRSLAKVCGPDVQIIVIDDGSSDGTADVASRFPCLVLRHNRNQGKGAAVRTGITHAQGTKIVVMDADATYPAEAIPRILSLLQDHDLVRGTRPSGSINIPWLNRIGNRTFDALLRVAHGLPTGDHLSGLYGLTREAAERLDLDADGFDLEVEIGIKAHSLRFDVASFDIGYATRIGEKKLRPLRDGIRIATQIGSLMLLFRPVVTFVVPGVLVTTVALVLSLVLARGPVVSGHWGFDYNSLIVATAGILGGFQFLMFGVAAAVYSAERGRPTGRLLPALRSWPLRGSMGMIGASVAIFGGVESARLSFGWLGTGGGPFLATRELVVATAAGIFGLQLLSASLFVSLLARRLPYARPGVGKVLQWGGTAKATDKPKKTP